MKRLFHEIDDLTFFLTLVTVGLCVLWIILTPTKFSIQILDPVITTLVIITAFQALVLEPQKKLNEKAKHLIEEAEGEKKRLLHRLDRECSLNGRVIQTTKLQSFHRYKSSIEGLEFIGLESIDFPRMTTSVIELVLTSELFLTEADLQLRKWLVPAQFDFNQFNWQLLVLQLQLEGKSNEEVIAKHKQFLDGRFVKRVETILLGLDLAVSEALGFKVDEIT